MSQLFDSKPSEAANEERGRRRKASEAYAKASESNRNVTHDQNIRPFAPYCKGFVVTKAEWFKIVFNNSIFKVHIVKVII